MASQLVLSGVLAVVFLVAGVRILVTGRTTIVNPNHRASSPGVVGAVLWWLRAPPPPDAPTGAHVEAAGGEARARGVLYVVLGLAFAAGFLATLLLG